MADRQDIDALLIGALYGELEGEERERLEAHLASHPGDRAALDDLRSTRAMFREAHLAEALGSAEPAPALSAKLLQEAARRAPVAKAAAGGGVLAWLSGLFRPLAAHPALSAAAALALVGGAAGILYRNGSFRTAQPEVASESRAMAPPAGTAGTAMGTAAPEPAAVDTFAAVGSGTGTGAGYPVALDEAQLKGELVRQEAVAPASASPASDKPGALAKKQAASESVGFARERAATGARPAPRATADYLEVSKNGRDELAVRDLDDSAVDGEEEVAEGTGGGGASAGLATGAVRAPSTPAPPPPATKPAAVADPGAAPRYDAKADAALTAWARDRHAHMVKLVTAGKCTEAGQVGADIARRAPEYYQASVANDRSVRNCIQYVDRARRAKQQEESKSRATQPSRNESPAPADVSK